jgi:sigma-B regulation protein RsbU (phosphoserine phosphatase)
MTSLRLRIAPLIGEPFVHVCEGESVVLGRSSKADLVLADRFLSRMHARLYREGERWLVEDLGSRNTTLLNGRPIQGPTVVRGGDVIKVSETMVTVEGDSSVTADLDDSSSGSTVFRPASALMADSDAALARSKLKGEDDLRKYTERLHVLNEVHRALASSISLDELFELILDRAFSLLFPEEGVIFLRNKQGEFYRAASRRLPGIGGEFLYSRRLVEEVTQKSLAALVQDATTDERFSSAQSMVASGVRSLVAAPLIEPDGCPGMIVLASRAHVRRFSEEDMELLVSLASVAALRVRNLALAEDAARRRLLEKELDTARSIQEALLPDELPDLPGYALYAVNHPSRTVSGDLYVVRERDGGECVVMVADVAGKGMAAALLTASLEALSVGPIEVGLPVHDICEKLSRRLFARTSPERYATAFLFALEAATGRVRHTNAGHNPALLLRGDGKCTKLPATGLPLGLLPFGDYLMEENVLEPGDTLVVYTDGFTEAANPQGDELGTDGLAEICRRHAHDPLPALAAAIEGETDKFAAGTPYSDDRTLVLVRRL